MRKNGKPKGRGTDHRKTQPGPLPRSEAEGEDPTITSFLCCNKIVAKEGAATARKGMHGKGNQGWDIEKSVCSSRQHAHALVFSQGTSLSAISSLNSLTAVRMRHCSIIFFTTHSLLYTAACVVPASILGVYLPQITTLQVTLSGMPPLLIT